MDVATAAAVQAVAAVVSLALTGALVGLTAYYAKQTRRTVEEMERGRAVSARTVEEMERSRALTERTIEEMRKSREATGRTIEEMVAGRELALMPMLICRLVVDHERAEQASNHMGAGTLDVAATYTTLMLTNIGNAPALDVTIRVVADPSDEGRLRLQPLECPVSIIGCADEWHRPLAFKQDLAPMVRALTDPQAPLDAAVTVEASYANAYKRRFVTRAAFELGSDARGIAWVQRESAVMLLTAVAHATQGAP